MPGTVGLRLGATGSGASALCVLVHGRGQSPEEMESLILARLPEMEVAFALPRAPSGSWYDARAIDPLDAITREQLGKALDLLASDIAALRGDYPGLPLLLAGFSQGACLALEYSFRGDAAPDALVAMTGCRVGTAACERPEAFPVNLPVYLTGSDADPWIPLDAMLEAAGSLGRRGANLRSDVFPGRAHEAVDAEIAMLASILEDFCAGRAPAMAAGR